MKARFLILIVILLLIAIPAPAQQVSKRISTLPSTNAVSATDSVIVSSGASPSTKTITTSNLLESLLLFPNWPVGSGSPQTNISYTAVTDAPWLTNDDARNITLHGAVLLTNVAGNMLYWNGSSLTLDSSGQRMFMQNGVFYGNGSGLTNLSGGSATNAINNLNGHGTNTDLLNPSYRGYLLSTNAFSIVRATVSVPPSAQTLMEGYTGDTNAASFSWRMTAVTNNFNPAVNTASPFSAMSDVQLHYGYNLTTSADYKTNLPVWVRGYESTWFNPYQQPCMEIYDRINLTNGLLSGTDVGFGYTVGLSNGFVKGTFSGDWLDLRTQFGDGSPWLTFANSTNNEGAITLYKGDIRTIATNEYVLLGDGAGLIGYRGSNYLFSSGGGYDNVFFFKGANENGSDLRLSVGSGALGYKSIRWNGTNTSDKGWEFQNTDGTFTRMSGNPFVEGVEIGPGTSPTSTFLLKRNTGTGKLDFYSRQNNYGGYRFNTPNKTNLLVLQDNDGSGGGSIFQNYLVSVGKATATATLDVAGNIRADSASLTNGLYTTNLTAPGGILIITGTISGNGNGLTNLPITGITSPTNTFGAAVVDFHGGNWEATTNMAGALTFSGVTNFNATNYNKFILHCLANGANRTITPASDWGKSRSVFVVTNGTKADLTITMQINVFTNMAQVDFF